MKIIKQVDISNWCYNHTCEECETEMEADRSDIKYQYIAGDRNEAGTDNFYFDCPVCSKSVYVPIAVVPKILQVLLKTNRAVPNSSGGYFQR
jgi:hypothetical protein